MRSDFGNALEFSVGQKRVERMTLHNTQNDFLLLLSALRSRMET